MRRTHYRIPDEVRRDEELTRTLRQNDADNRLAGFAGRLLFAIDQRGMTRGQLSRVTGVDPGSLCRYVGPRRCLPDARQLALIESALGVTTDWLLLGESGQKPSSVEAAE